MVVPSKVSQPFQLTPTLTLPNRFVLAPMTRRKSPNHIPTDAVAAYYARRAVGGFGLIVSEGTLINGTTAGDSSGLIPGCYTQEQAEAWAKVNAAVKAASEGRTKTMVQLWHQGPVSAVPVGPVEKPATATTPAVHALTEEEINVLAAEFAHAAKLAVEVAKFDTIQLHFAHGYLGDSFLSVDGNKRSDKFGPGAEGKTLPTFGSVVLRAVRAAIGPQVPLFVRISQWAGTNYQEIKWRTSEEFANVLGQLHAAGASGFDISTRRILAPAFPDEHATRSLAGWARQILPREVPVTAVGTVSLDREYVRDLPGQFQVVDPTPALEMIEAGEADLLGIGRGALSDPEWPNKVMAGRWQELVPYSTAFLAELN
jgi:2,4-dienoyl-CoA reductase-like NADH-dependent reductase (Old Yellow Enzyme family)